jgi:hypothetical protein
LQTVDLLLRAGVDVNAVDAAGNSAIDWAKISRAKVKASKIIQLLEHAGAHQNKRTSKLPQPLDFAARAKSASFRKAIAVAKTVTKSPGKTVQLATGPLPGAHAFLIRDRDLALHVLNKVRTKVTQLGAFAFISEEMGVSSLVLIPSVDYRDAIIAFETPVGQSIDCYKLIDWLNDIEKTWPFVITHIAQDRIQARFTTEIRNSKKLAKSIRNICPDVADTSLELDKVAKHLERSGELFLWWD